MLWVHYNDLEGSIPESFLGLRALESFRFGPNADLCTPGTTDFVTWLKRIEDTERGPYCNESDVGMLNQLYGSSGGLDWTNSTGWRETPALEEWYGVTANSLGRVVTLDLAGNGLEGWLPAGLGNLAEMTVLRVGDNALSGRLPLSLSQLSLVKLHYAGTGLCVSAEPSFEAWLNGLPSHEGTGTKCGTLRGTVSDGRREGLVIPGAIVRLEGTSESVTTDADGQYRLSLSDVSGTVRVTVSADPSYLERTVEVTVDSDRTLDFVLEHTGEAPYPGTVWVTADILGPSDPTSLGSITYTGRGMREVFDRRVDRWVRVDAYLFEAQFGERTVEFQLNPEFGSREAAGMQVDAFAPAIGRLPAVLMSNLREVEINAGEGAFGGNSYNGSILIHTEDRSTMDALRGGFLEEAFLHEAAHASLDPLHADAPGWRAAQQADRAFISEYAQDFPDREDIAESILPYFAVRYRPDRLTAAQRWLMTMTTPNRIAYFDDQDFDMSPYTPAGPIAPVPATEPIRPLPQTQRRFEDPPIPRP